MRRAKLTVAEAISFLDAHGYTVKHVGRFKCEWCGNEKTRKRKSENHNFCSKQCSLENTQKNNRLRYAQEKAYEIQANKLIKEYTDEYISNPNNC